MNFNQNLIRGKIPERNIPEDVNVTEEQIGAINESGGLSSILNEMGQGLGGAVGETIRTNKQSTSLNPFDLFKMKQGAPLGGSFQYEPGNYVGIFDTYEPIGKSFQRQNYQPMEFQEYQYEPYIHEPSQYQPRKYEPIIWEPSKWTPSEYSELEYQKTDVTKEPYESPIQDPAHYEQLSNELTPYNGDILYDNIPSAWADSPIFKSSGISDSLFGSPKTPNEMNSDTVINEGFDISKPTGMKEILFGGEKQASEINNQYIPKPVVNFNAQNGGVNTNRYIPKNNKLIPLNPGIQNI